MKPQKLGFWFEVTVRFSGNAYVARAGTGVSTKRASSTNCPLVAAQDVARKFCGEMVSPAQIALITAGSCGTRKPWIYEVRNVGPVLVSAEIEWHFCPDLPDDEITVLIANGDAVDEGAHHGDHWETSAGAFLDGADVYAWAYLPVAPDRPGEGGGA